MAKIYIIYLSIFALIGLVPLSANATLSLDQYLQEVQKSNQGLLGATVTQHADMDASLEAQLPFATQFFTNLQYTDDRRQTIVPSFEGNRTLTESGQAGFKKLFDYGLQAQVSYGSTSNTLYGVDPRLVPQNSLITSALTLQVTQSLWQNGFGQGDRATRKAVQAQDLANAYSSAYQTKSILADAESRYWALAIAKELVTIQKESAARTVTIRDFNSRRVRSHLIDEADLLTSQAQVKSKQFDLKTAIDNQRTAVRAFNSARGIDSDQMEDSLGSLSPELLQNIEVPKRAALRDDVKSAEQAQIVVTANSEAAIQRQLPLLNLVGTGSTNGLDPNLRPSMSDTLGTHYPYYTIGVNLSVPLDFDTVRTVKRAYAEQKRGAELTFRRRLFDQENDWKDLLEKLTEAKERLSIAIDLERAQKLKLQHESTRQKQGLTTTYQVFEYEIDYLSSELHRLQAQQIILNLVSQMKTYRSDL